jgi:hypothetical protein
MEAMREAWTDGRLDDLNHKVDEGFRRVDADLRGLRSEVRSLGAEVNGRFDALQRVLILSHAGIVAALIGVIATQL